MAVAEGRPLRVLVIHPGASWSTHDVYEGLTFGLRAHGVEVFTYRLDTQLDASQKSLYWLWRTRKRSVPDLPKPNGADVLHHAGICALDSALDRQVDVILVVSAMYIHPSLIVKWKRAGLRVVVLFTESPYDLEQEHAIAALVDGCWTNERTAVAGFRAVNPRTGYLPHAWHPETHTTAGPIPADVPAHDVVFVGSGFKARAQWFNSIDWTGINLGLYGTWDKVGLAPALQACVQPLVVTNQYAAWLYRRAKMGLNLYRRSRGFGLDGPPLTHVAESLNPRAYELAALGVFHLSDARAEVEERFGDLVPTFTTAGEAAVLIRHYLTDNDERVRLAAALPATVAEASWVQRSRDVIGDLRRLLFPAPHPVPEENDDGSVCRTQWRGVSVDDGERRALARVAAGRLDRQPRDGQIRGDVVR